MLSFLLPEGTEHNTITLDLSAAYPFIETLIFFKGTCKCIRVYIYIDDNASKREEGFWDTVKGLKKGINDDWPMR